MPCAPPYSPWSEVNTITVLALTAGWRRELREHAPDLAVDVGLQEQVRVHQAAPRRDHFGAVERHGAERARGGLLQRAVQQRLAAGQQLFGRLEVRRDFADPRRRFALPRDFAREAVPPGDVVGVDERDGRAPRPVARLVVEPVLELVDDRRVDLGALPGGAVGRGIGPAGEAVRLERRPRVGVQMPLAPPRRLVVQLAQQRPPRREAGAQPAAAGDHAAGLVRVQAGQQRPARGRAVVRRGVVAFEADRLAAQRREVRQQRVERQRRRRPRRRAQLVDEDHEDVRRPARAACAAHPAAPLVPRRAWPAPLRGRRRRTAPARRPRAALA